MKKILAVMLAAVALLATACVSPYTRTVAVKDEDAAQSGMVATVTSEIRAQDVEYIGMDGGGVLVGMKKSGGTTAFARYDTHGREKEHIVTIPTQVSAAFMAGGDRIVYETGQNGSPVEAVCIADGRSTPISRLDTAIVNSVSHNSDEYICNVQTDGDSYKMTIYDLEDGDKDVVQVEELAGEAVRSQLDSVKVLDAFYAGGEKYVVHISREGQSYIIIVSEGEQFVVCKSTEDAPYAAKGTLFYKNTKNTLMALDMEKNEEVALAEEVDLFDVSADGTVVAYSVETQGMENLFIKRVGWSGREAIDVRKKILFICMSADGSRLLAKYAGGGRGYAVYDIQKEK